MSLEDAVHFYDGSDLGYLISGEVSIFEHVAQSELTKCCRSQEKKRSDETSKRWDQEERKKTQMIRKTSSTLMKILIKGLHYLTP